MNTMSESDSYPENRSERRKRENRQRMLAAATDLLLREGYDGVTIQAIMDRADLGYGTFYGHFASKEAIIWEVFREGADARLRLADEAAARYPSPLRELMGWVYYFETIGNTREYLAPMIGSGGNPDLRDRYQAYVIQTITRNLEQQRYQPAPLFRDLPVDYLARFIAGTQLHLTDWLLTPDCPYTPRQLAELLFRTLYHDYPPELLVPDAVPGST